MAITVTNTNTSMLLNILNQNMARQSTLMRQLTTGKRINSGKDDPAGLIALSGLNAELRAVNASLSNNMRTDSMLTVADQAIGQVQDLLGEIQTLVQASTSSANLTNAEIAANQSQIDDALSAIDRIVNTTNFNGKRLLDGSLGIATTGVSNTFLDNVRVYSRSQSNTDTTITVNRVASAQVGTSVLNTFAASSTTKTHGTTNLIVTGELGTANIQLTSAMAQSAVVAAINAATDQTGVVASGSAARIDLNSSSYGTDAFVSVQVLSGGEVSDYYGIVGGEVDGDGALVTSVAGNNFANIAKTIGADANITINGQSTGADGLDVTYSANGLSMSFTLSTAFGSGAQATASTTFIVKSNGGATFQLGTNASTRATIGIDSLASFNLGGGNGTSRLAALKSGGASALKTDTEAALKSVRDAIASVASIRGRIGGFQKFQVGAAIASLQVATDGLTQAASIVGDTDYALATSQLAQTQVLVQSGIALLGVANQQAGQILSLLL